MTVRISTLLRIAETLASALVGLASIAGPSLALAEAEEPIGGVEFMDGSERRLLPMAKSDVTVVIRGDLASVRLVQLFENPHAAVVHARYVFPLPPDAAVHALRMQSGDRLIEAEIRRKPEARAVYEAAKVRGNTAALLEQQRPDVFTQEIANLLPGEPIRVELEYVHPVRKAGADFEFRLPLVVGPRYLPDAAPIGDDPGWGSDPAGAPTRAAGEPEGLSIGRWQLPGSSPVAASGSADDARVSIEIDLLAGVPISLIESPSHPVAIDAPDDESRHIRLARGRSLGDRDFVLRYRLAGEQIAAGATTASDGRDGFLSLLVEPPLHPGELDITAREVVFVLDCSGSMAGVPLDVSKRFMRRMLPRLRPDDQFRIIRFSDTASSPTETPIPATPGHIRAGLAYIDSLNGEGGTEMTSGIRAALRPPVPDGALRLVVFLTDGYIGNDVEIVRLIQQTRGDARLFAFGIGHSVNHFLIREMARVGRGAARIVSVESAAGEAADQLAERLQSPLLTDVTIDWGRAPVVDAAPDPLPDLFLGQSLRVLARYTAGGRHRIHVDGRIAGRPARIAVDLDLPDPAVAHGPEALGITWARAQIEDRMTRYLDPARNQVEREQLEEEVTDLGLEHRLVTQWTSFVAVARQIVNPAGRGHDADVRVPRVHGLADSAYPPGALPGSPASPAASATPQLVASFAPGSGFAGQAAPEPGTWIGLAVLSCLAALVWRSGQRRRHSEVSLGTHPGGRR